jgi:hypothetical protein
MLTVVWKMLASSRATTWRCHVAVSITLLVGAWPSTAHAASPVNPKVEFNRDIRPILSDKCFACHGLDAKHRKAKLRLDTLDGATADRDGVRAIVPGNLSKSAVWAKINSDDPDEVMPPQKSNKTLTAADKQTIRRWIEQGAKYQAHWSFEPIIKPEAPSSAAGYNAIDAFLFARLKNEGLKPAREADRPTLIRRVSFSLTGLPPTPAEVDAFLNDHSANAYERMVDQYLASPRYGEEMARHWLDVARYGDTHGMHLDNERQMWAYRDYVIKSFNDNKRFDRFTVEQLAGDLLPNPTREQLTATGYNRCNVTSSEGGSIDAELIFRYAVDRTATTMTTWMGLTGGCAVCHDHKFDPISAQEFYSLYAFFYSAADPAMDENALLTRPTVRLPTSEQEKKLAALDSEIAAKQKELDAKTAALAYTDPASLDPWPSADDLETVWMDDDFPPGAQAAGSPGEPTQWQTEQVFSGKRALKRSDKGLAQDYYETGAAPLDIPPSGVVFAHVFIDPKNPPKTIMLQFHKGDWNHRAIWGEYDTIPWGQPNSTEKSNFGPLPEAGRWVRLEIPIAKIGLQPGDQIAGFALTQVGGTVYWDKVGIKGQINPAADPTRSLLAWRKLRVGQDTPGAPAHINKLLKTGPEKVTKPAELEQLRVYYLQNVCADTRPQLSGLSGEVTMARKQRQELDQQVPSTFVFSELPKSRDSFIMIRGQYDKPGQKVEPGTPAFLPRLKRAGPTTRATRLDLANWLVTPEHPLTSRVAINRLWQQFFGTGLVKSSGDFGAQGQVPSHPELLDWLAASFRDGGWDVKSMVRIMITSAAFREETAVSPELLARDPENRLYARGPRFRLDAEQIRDNALFVSGLLNVQTGGRGAMTYQPANIWEPVGFDGSNTRIYTQDTGPALYRRSIYTFLKRTAPPPFMMNFDAPSREQTCTHRERSDTPLQALQLMNDVQHFEAARALAERMLTQGGATPAERIAFAFRVVLARAPVAAELEIVQAELTSHLTRYQKDEASAKKAISHGQSKPKADLPAPELASYTLVANMLLNLDETVNRN